MAVRFQSPIRIRGWGTVEGDWAVLVEKAAAAAGHGPESGERQGVLKKIMDEMMDYHKNITAAQPQLSYSEVRAMLETWATNYSGGESAGAGAGAGAGQSRSRSPQRGKRHSGKSGPALGTSSLPDGSPNARRIEAARETITRNQAARAEIFAESAALRQSWDEQLAALRAGYSGGGRRRRIKKSRKKKRTKRLRKSRKRKSRRSKSRRR